MKQGPLAQIDSNTPRCTQKRVKAVPNPPLPSPEEASNIDERKREWRELVKTWLQAPMWSGYANGETTQEMRRDVVRWMLRIITGNKYKRETFHLAVKLFDIYIARNFVEVSWLNAIGLGAILIAGKLKEVETPRPTDLIKKTGNCFTLDQLLLLESDVLKQMRFKLYIATSDKFLNVLIHTASSFVGGTLPPPLVPPNDMLAVLQMRELNYPPGQVAACVFYAAHGTFWNSTLADVTGTLIPDASVAADLMDMYKTLTE
eukprot:TRINITY_DN1327_c13_g1_i1.p1 TRINITY_DN1327_c13_g1~~TRINITY_DN1327_c13_g1_i1.p1  ORF type:complete len:281 (+),score=29.58 TRINITY_DN1327_c13_g1_i1:65-844(+)